MSETAVAPVNDAVVTVKVNKSKLILEAFKVNGLDAPANDVIQAIKTEHGVDVTVSLINNIRCRLRKKKAERLAKRIKGVSAPVTATPAGPETDTLSRLFAVKEFAATVGGLAELKSLVGKLESLLAS